MTASSIHLLLAATRYSAISMPWKHASVRFQFKQVAISNEDVAKSAACLLRTLFRHFHILYSTTITWCNDDCGIYVVCSQLIARYSEIINVFGVPGIEFTFLGDYYPIYTVG